MEKLNILEQSTTICIGVYKQYCHILQSYVCDYYVKNHWGKLPKSWQEYLETLTINEIANLLEPTATINYKECPLSILCLREILRRYALPRQKSVNLTDSFEKEFMKYLSKNVKLKKRHEITIMAKSCYQSALKTNCFNIVDIGAGLGHLSRMLAYGYGFKVCTFEANSVLTETAGKLDKQFENIIKLKSIEHKNTTNIVHLNKRIENDISVEEFLSLVRSAFKTESNNFKFGIVGLHPCGNLGSTLLKIYKEIPNVVFINIVGCCYMKLTLSSDICRGFPLSNFCSKKNINLDYLSCEMACHAIENYIEKIRQGDQSHLKVHSFRAALEMLIVDSDPELQHSQVGNVKYEPNMLFNEYCKKALKKVHSKVKTNEIAYYQSIIDSTWINVVKFYSIKLLMAPIVESIILYDRLLYLLESKSDCDIVPAFDYRISPRNHILFGTKY